MAEINPLAFAGRSLDDTLGKRLTNADAASAALPTTLAKQTLANRASAASDLSKLRGVLAAIGETPQSIGLGGGGLDRIRRRQDLKTMLPSAAGLGAVFPEGRVNISNPLLFSTGKNPKIEAAFKSNPKNVTTAEEVVTQEDYAIGGKDLVGVPKKRTTKKSFKKAQTTKGGGSKSDSALVEDVKRGMRQFTYKGKKYIGRKSPDGKTMIDVIALD
tara:strand:+ start:272 stop:919 length:648 start_codon:yes stop_codon:yes gene_type:complete